MAAAAASTITPAAGSVLVVDDDPDFAESLFEILDSVGYVSRCANSAQEARDSLLGNDADVVLVDVRLGTVDGIDLIEEFRSRWPDKIYIAMTAYASIDSALLALKNGAYDFLRKPFHPDELFASLNRAFERVQLHKDQRRALLQLEASERRFRELTEGSVQD